MPNYIRANAPGGTFFFTARLQDRDSHLLVREVDRLRQAVRDTRSRYPFTIDAIVVLPAAIHTIWTLPENDADFSIRWSFLKRRFSREFPTPAFRTASQMKRREKGIWQRRFWEHRIRTRRDFEAHRQMIHSAPVLLGLAATPGDWTWTSFHRDIAASPEWISPVPTVGYSTRQSNGAGKLHFTPHR